MRLLPLLLLVWLNTIDGLAQDQSEVENYYWVCQFNFETATSKRLFVVPKLNSIGSVACSPNGQWIAFDGAVPGKHSTSNLHIFVCKMDGTDLQDLGPGTMPSWSPRGKRIAFTRFSPEHGVWIMNADGSDARLIDNQGWGAQWSPDGNMIAYRRRLKTNDDFVIFNLVEDEFSTVFGKNASGYSSLNWNFAWSPDNTRLCFKGSSERPDELGVVRISSPERMELIRQDSGVNADFTWLDDSTIVTSLRSNQLKRTQLYKIDAKSDSDVSPIVGQFTGRSNFDPDVSRDGRTMLYVSRKPIR